MSILWFGGEMGALVPANSDTIENTAVGSFDSAFCRCSTLVNHYLSYGETPNFGAQTGDVYIHFETKVGTSGWGTGTTRNVLVCLNNAGTQVFRINCDSGSEVASVIQMQWSSDGVTWTNIGATVAYSGNTLQTIDLYINPDATGSAKLYMAGTLRTSGTANLAGMTDIAKVRFVGSNRSYWSQGIVATESTIGMRVGAIVMTGQGSTHTFTAGGFGNIDEIPYSDADIINSDTATQVELFTGTPVPSFTSYVIRALSIGSRSRNGGSGPTQLQLALRSAGTTYFSGTKTLDVGYGAICNVWETNPATSAAFLSSEIAALEYGVKSIA